MDYAGVTGQWAVTVARGVHRRGMETSPPTIVEIWVDSGLALYLRYRLGAQKLATRFRLDVDPTSGGPPTDAERFASDVFHNLHTDPGPDRFVDDGGYRWWGDDVPDGGWEAAVHGKRILSLSCGREAAGPRRRER